MRNPASTARAASPILLVALATFAAGTLSANLLHVARSQGCNASLSHCASRAEPWSQPDSLGYVRLARQIRKDGLGSLTFERRTPGYPLVLAASLELTGAVRPALWLAVPCGALATAALAWISGLITRRRGAVIATGLSVATSFSVHALAPMLLTDALHGFLVACGLASALAWRESQRPGWAAASALAWIASQSLRPTFFPVALLLAALLFTRNASRRSLRISALLCAATLIVPVAIVTSNWLNFGLASPSIKLSYAAACESVPELKSRLGLAEQREAREACREEQRALPPAQRVRRQNAEALEFFRAYPAETASMLIASLREQLLFPTRPAHRDEFAQLYPSWAVVGGYPLALYWIAAFSGSLLLWRRDRGLALFIGGSFALVMLPSMLIHSAGARYRFPAELLCLIPAVLCGERFLSSALARWRARGGAQA